MPVFVGVGGVRERNLASVSVSQYAFTLGRRIAMSLLPILSRVQRSDEVSLPARQIFDQGSVNCCFSCALASAIEARGAAVPPLAPLYHFHFAGGASRIETGLTDTEAKSALIAKGMSAFTHHPFAISTTNVRKVPGDSAVADGPRNKPRDPKSNTLLWKRIRNTDAERSWVRHLRAGAPIVIGLQPNDDYLALNAQRPTLRTNAGPYSRIAHAAVVLGYRDAVSAFVIQDSRRGTDFGVGGQWFLPYSLATSPFVVLAIALSPADF